MIVGEQQYRQEKSSLYKVMLAREINMILNWFDMFRALLAHDHEWQKLQITVNKY